MRRANEVAQEQPQINYERDDAVTNTSREVKAPARLVNESRLYRELMEDYKASFCYNDGGDIDFTLRFIEGYDYSVPDYYTLHIMGPGFDFEVNFDTEEEAAAYAVGFEKAYAVIGSKVEDLAEMFGLH